MFVASYGGSQITELPTVYPTNMNDPPSPLTYPGSRALSGLTIDQFNNMVLLLCTSARIHCGLPCARLSSSGAFMKPMIFGSRRSGALAPGCCAPRVRPSGHLLPRRAATALQATMARILVNNRLPRCQFQSVWLLLGEWRPLCSGICGAGSYAVAGSSSCSQCPAGRYGACSLIPVMISALRCNQRAAELFLHCPVPSWLLLSSRQRGANCLYRRALCEHRIELWKRYADAVAVDRAPLLACRTPLAPSCVRRISIAQPRYPLLFFSLPLITIAVLLVI